MKTILIKDLKAGMELTDFFALRKKELKEYDGQKFLKLELGDKSGRVDAVLWEEGEKFHDSAEVGDIVKIKGVTQTYRNSLQIKLEKFRKAKENEADPIDFVKSSEKDLDLLFEKYKEKIQSIQDPFLKQLLHSLLSDKALMEKFKKAPGGKLWHHAYLGGLLEHTLQVTSICEHAAQSYELVDRDLLLTGALIHDIGKINQYSVTSFIDFTDEGRLVGHIVSGDELLEQKIEKIKGFPESLALKLKHLLLSHQGEQKLGSPVVPQTIEAVILHYADQLDAKANAFSHIIKKQRKGRKKWSDWVPLIERFIYLGEEED